MEPDAGDPHRGRSLRALGKHASVREGEHRTHPPGLPGELEGLVDPLDREPGGDELVEQQPAFQVELEDAGTSTSGEMVP